MMTGSLESGKRRTARCSDQCCRQPTLGTPVLEFSDPGLDLISFSRAAQGENPFLVKVTVVHICSNLPEAASGDFGHTAK